MHLTNPAKRSVFGRGAIMYELLIQNALVFDGSGDLPRKCDVAVSEGRIAAIVDIADDVTSVDRPQARETIDGEGLWLTPGLLDIHTHFDLEVELAPGLPEAVRHGTTTVVMSNCSLGLAFGAQRENQQNPIVDCFARVENVPKSVLQKVVDRVDWNDSAGYFEHLDALPLGPNVVPMIPHSMLRIEVMGLKDSISRNPTRAELDRMTELLEAGMRQGYAGFSTDALPFHYLANQPNTRRKIPAQYGSFGELRRLTDVVRRHDRVWQATPPKDNPIAVLRNFLLTSGRFFGRTLKITAVAAMDLVTNRSIIQLVVLLTRLLNSKFIRGRFILQALPAAFKVWGEGAITPLAEEIPVLRELNETELEDRAARRAVMDQPGYRKRFRKMWYTGLRGFGLHRIKRWLGREDIALTRQLRDMVVESCPVPDWTGEDLQSVYERMLRGDSRSEIEGDVFEKLRPKVRDDADFIFELLREFDTDLYWHTVTANADPQVVRELIMHPKLLPGFNDSGAHLTNMAFYDGNLRSLRLAREIGIERGDELEAVAYTVRRLTREPAEFFGVDAGRLEAGARADLVLIDPRRLAEYDGEAGVQVRFRDEFEYNQLVNRSDGVVPCVVIGGEIVWQNDDFTPSLGSKKLGAALRAGSQQAAPVPVKV